MADVKYFTKEGLEGLKQELNNLKTGGRKAIARQLAEARDKGDLSENAEYDAAKEAQQHLEMRIAQLERTLSQARMLDASKIDTSKVQVLSNVRLRDLKKDLFLIYQLVSDAEADFKAGKISVASPIGRGLLGRVIGERVVIHVPAGTLEFEIIEITF
jgi:transcription elongation factor GreA